MAFSLRKRSPSGFSLLMSWEDIGTDHPDIPAAPSNSYFAEFRILTSEWQPAKPKTVKSATSHVDMATTLAMAMVAPSTR